MPAHGADDALHLHRAPRLEVHQHARLVVHGCEARFRARGVRLGVLRERDRGRLVDGGVGEERGRDAGGACDGHGLRVKM